jgi:predicted nucleotidyltransferase
VPPIFEQYRDALADICRRHHVKRLELFGSAARGELRPDSDLDFIVEFESIPLKGFADNFFGLMQALSDTFQRPVDLIDESRISNPYFLRAINGNRKVLYAA